MNLNDPIALRGLLSISATRPQEGDQPRGDGPPTKRESNEPKGDGSNTRQNTIKHTATWRICPVVMSFFKSNRGNQTFLSTWSLSLSLCDSLCAFSVFVCLCVCVCACLCGCGCSDFVRFPTEVPNVRVAFKSSVAPWNLTRVHRLARNW